MTKAQPNPAGQNASQQGRLSHFIQLPYNPHGPIGSQGGKWQNWFSSVQL